jgi:hypothetical protein
VNARHNAFEKIGATFVILKYLMKGAQDGTRSV